MDVPTNVPTDSLHKFMAIAGLVGVLAITVLFEQFHLHVQDKVFALQKDQAITRADTQVLDEELKALLGEVQVLERAVDSLEEGLKRAESDNKPAGKLIDRRDELVKQRDELVKRRNEVAKHRDEVARKAATMEVQIKIIDTLKAQVNGAVLIGGVVIALCAAAAVWGFLGWHKTQRVLDLKAELELKKLHKEYEALITAPSAARR